MEAPTKILAQMHGFHPVEQKWKQTCLFDSKPTCLTAAAARVHLQCLVFLSCQCVHLLLVSPMRGYATQDKLRSITDHSDDHSIGASDQIARLDFHLGVSKSIFTFALRNQARSNTYHMHSVYIYIYIYIYIYVN